MSKKKILWGGGGLGGIGIWEFGRCVWAELFGFGIFMGRGR